MRLINQNIKIALCPETETASGLIIPDVCSKRFEVLQSGDTFLSKGDTVVLDRYLGKDFNKELFVKRSEILYKNDYEPVENYMRVELDRLPDELQFKNGKIHIDPNYNVGQHAPVCGVVKSLPKVLSTGGDISVRVGDKVWFSFNTAIHALGSGTFFGGEKVLHSRQISGTKDVFISHLSVIVIRREEGDYCLNGHYLCEPMPTEKKFLLYAKEELSRDICKVVTLDIDNELGLSVGDKVILGKHWDIPLEYDIHRQYSDKTLYAVHERGIMAKMVG
jgi:hypothetical protein